MGQKVHPYGFRLVSVRKPRSRWFAEGEQYRRQLIEDLKLREYIHDTQRNAAISEIIIDRTADTVTVTIRAAKPGIMIGRGGRDVDRLRQRLAKMVGAKVRVNVEETPEPDLCAQLIAENVAWQIERRVSPRRAMGQAIERALERGAQGVRCAIAGRIGGAEIARRESMGPEGRVPLHTLRADIDYGVTEARTGYGHIGIKVWVYRGDILPPQKKKEEDVWEELEAEVAQLEERGEVPGDEIGAETTEAEMVVAGDAAEPGGAGEAGEQQLETDSTEPATAAEALPEVPEAEEPEVQVEAEAEAGPVAVEESEAEEPEVQVEVEAEAGPVAVDDSEAEETRGDEIQETDSDVDAEAT